MVERKAGVFRFFGVDDIREIRNSPRFKTAVAEKFDGDIDLIVENQGADLLCIGKLKSHPRNEKGEDYKGAYLLACDDNRPHLGCFVRASMVL